MSNVKCETRPSWTCSESAPGVIEPLIGQGLYDNFLIPCIDFHSTGTVTVIPERGLDRHTYACRPSNTSRVL